VQLWEVSDKGRTMRLPEANFMDWKSQSRSFEGMAMFGSAVQLIAGGSEPIRARVAEVSRGFFDILKVSAIVGTTFGRAWQQDAHFPEQNLFRHRRDAGRV